MFARDIRSSAEIDRFYVDGYHDRRHMDGQRVNARVNVDLVRRFCPDLSGKSLLDVGSGYGFFLAGLRASGAARIAGVELSRAQRIYSLRELQLETHARMDDLADDDRFDVITAFEVIEHIATPYEFVLGLCDHLKDGGSLILGTDNFAADVVTALGEQFPKWIPHEHVSFFTPASLAQMLARSGRLTPCGTRSFTPWELILRQLVFRATGGRKGGKPYRYRAEDDAAKEAGYRHFALRLAANRVWFKLTSRANPNGEMMYVHMRKSAPAAVPA
jgi:2-polyprenyl-3-methyl-5-hydroxy-6-metoxy-1,4-benzoquinol methylase